MLRHLRLAHGECLVEYRDNDKKLKDELCNGVEETRSSSPVTENGEGDQNHDQGQ